MTAQANIKGRVVICDNLRIISRKPHGITISSGIILVISSSGDVDRHEIPYGAFVEVTHDQLVEAGRCLASWDPMTIPMVAESGGLIEYADLEDGISCALQVDAITQISLRVVLKTKKAQKFEPRLVINVAQVWQYCTRVLPEGTMIFVKDGDYVQPGDIIIRYPN